MSDEAVQENHEKQWENQMSGGGTALVDFDYDPDQTVSLRYVARGGIHEMFRSPFPHLSLRRPPVCEPFPNYAVPCIHKFHESV